VLAGVGTAAVATGIGFGVNYLVKHSSDQIVDTDMDLGENDVEEDDDTVSMTRFDDASYSFY